MPVNTQWQSWFLKEAVGGDMRYKYVPFHELSMSERYQVQFSYPHNDCGGKYNFVFQHYFYPVKMNGRLAKARRSLAIPYDKICDEKAMAELGYTVNSNWQER